MRWRHPTNNPADDKAADEVIAAFEAAEQAGKPPVACYCAAVDAWLRVHPEQAPHYAARQAVEVIYAGRGILLET